MQEQHVHDWALANCEYHIIDFPPPKPAWPTWSAWRVWVARRNRYVKAGLFHAICN